jgi:hypothetical protein
MFSTSSLIQVYLDTNGILKYCQIKDPKTSERKILAEIYELFKSDKISLFTTQGSFSDIWGDNDEKITSEASKFAASEREKTRLKNTFPLATNYIETVDDFDEISIELYNIFFDDNLDKNNIMHHYNNLDSNDRVDFLVLRDCIRDANNSSYFITQNKKDFINNGKKEKLERYATSKGKSFIISIINEEVLNMINNDITEMKI